MSGGTRHLSNFTGDINFDHWVKVLSSFSSASLLSFLLQLISNLYGDITVYF